jgi:hypothetical protein
MKDPKESIEWAMGLTKDVPEEFRVVAFAELLRYSLSLISNTPGNSDLNKNNRPLPSLHNISNGLPDLHLLAQKGSRDQHVAWAVAELFARGEEVNNESIRRIIKEHLAITPPVRQNTNRSLRDLTPKYIIRTKVGKKYFYSPSARLLEIFEGLEDTK